MIVALAVYSREVDAALRLLRWINELGGCKFHTLVLATTPMVDPGPLYAEAQQGWGRVEHLQIAREIEKWPEGPNNHFTSVAEYMKDRNEAFLFLESDMTPLCPNWLEQLEREYQLTGKAFMGCVQPLPDGKGGFFPDTMHMNGGGIYPARVLAFLPTFPYMGAMQGPWDMLLRWEILYLVDGSGGFRPGTSNGRVSACHPTPLMCLGWKTQNYREGGNGQILFDLIGDRSYNNAVNLNRHVLHHGCKDGSLLEVVRSRLFPPPPPMPVPVAPKQEAPPPPPPAIVPPAPKAPPAPPAATKPPAPPRNPRLPAAAFKKLPTVPKKTPGRKKKAEAKAKPPAVAS